MVKAVKKLSVLALLLAALFVFSVAAEASTISITNRTGYDIYYIFLTDSGVDHWGEDLLGPDHYLPNGSTIELEVVVPFQQFDIRWIDEDEDVFELRGVSGDTTDITLVIRW